MAEVFKKCRVVAKFHTRHSYVVCRRENGPHHTADLERGHKQKHIEYTEVSNERLESGWKFRVGDQTLLVSQWFDCYKVFGYEGHT